MATPRCSSSLPRVPASMPLLGVHGLSFWFEELVVVIVSRAKGMGSHSVTLSEFFLCPHPHL